MLGVVAFRNVPHDPDLLIVLMLSRDSDVTPHEVVYDGPFILVRQLVSKYGSNGQARVALSKLRLLNARVVSSERVPRRAKGADVSD